MTKNILKTALLVLGAGSVMTGCDFEQPEAPCFVQDSTAWVAKYDRVDEPRDANGAACTTVAPRVELLGAFKFVDPDRLDEPKLALRPQGLASLGARDTTTDQAEQTAIGDLDAEPGADNFCQAENFEVARVVANATATAPATNITYVFNNIRVYAAPSAPGTQLTGELTYTRDGCTSNYVISAIWPAIPCVAGSTDPAESCGAGSGLNPDFAATCLDGVANCGGTGCCVAEKAIPSFR
jgi:hypothetical protein